MTRCIIKHLMLERKTESGSFSLEFDTNTMVLDSSEFGNSRKIPIMGQSGAGKSTLLNAMAAISWPKSGSIEWCFPERKDGFLWCADRPLAAKQAQQLRRQFFGFVFQNTSLLTYCTIGENLVYPQLLLGTGVRKAKKNARRLLKSAIPDKDQGSLMQRYIHEISGGERQRVALAQALVNNPYVVFADEPTGSLDPTTRKTIMEMLYQWVNDDEHRLLLWVTHHEDDPASAASNERLMVKKTHFADDTQYCQCKREML